MARVDEILEKYGFKRNAQTTWTVQGNQVIYHHVLEAIAHDLKITWDEPKVLRAEKDECVILVGGSMDGMYQWAIGEALVGVNYRVSGKQAAYVYAMAEKRAKDRLVYKFLGLAEQFDDTAAEGTNQAAEKPAENTDVSKMTVLEKFKHNIMRKQSLTELRTWMEQDPIKMAYNKLDEVGQRQVMHWANERAGQLPKEPTSQPEGIWVAYLDKTKKALAKAKNEQEVNSYESMLKEQEFAEAPADVLQAFAELCEGRRYELRTR